MPCPLGHEPDAISHPRIIAAIAATLAERRLPYIAIADPNNKERESTLFRIWLSKCLPRDPESHSFGIYVELCGCMLAEIPKDPKVERIANEIRNEVLKILEVFSLADEAAKIMKEKGQGKNPRPVRRPGRDRLPRRRR